MYAHAHKMNILHRFPCRRRIIFSLALIPRIMAFFKHVSRACLLVADIVHNPLPHFLGAILAATGNLYLGSAHIGL